MDPMFHQLKIEEILDILNLDKATVTTGLCDASVISQRCVFGANQFSEKKKKGFWTSFLTMYCQPFNLLLLIASLLSCCLYAFNTDDVSNICLSIGILVVSILNTCLEFYQEYQTNELLKGFADLVPSTCVVLRNNVASTIPTKEVVVGDIIMLKIGDKLAADVRLITSNSLSVNSSSLTGESEPVKKKVVNSVGEYQRAENMCFSGDLITTGYATGIVVSVGNSTVLGKIAALTTDKSRQENELTAEINSYVRKLGLVALVTSIVFYIISLYNGFEIQQNLVFCVGIFIAFVPQGLPATVTILLTIAAKKMSAKNVLVKDLRAVETLGAISLLATDKTGTLTQGKMKSNMFWDGNRTFKLFSECGKVPGDIGLLPIVNALYASSTINHQEGSRADPTEKALYTFAEDYLKDMKKEDSEENERPDPGSSEIRDPRNLGHKNHESRNNSDTGEKVSGIKGSLSFEKIYEEPFDSTRKIHVSVCRINGKYKIIVKGAPDRVIKQAATYGNQILSINEDFMAKYEDMYETFAGYGQRVIAVAEKTLSETELRDLELKIGKKLPINQDLPIYTSALVKNHEKDIHTTENHPQTLINTSNTVEHSNKESKEQKFSPLNKKTNDCPYSTQQLTSQNEIPDNIDISGLNFLGIVGIVDPPKKGVRNAIMKLRLAGIQVVMVTGDHPLTAAYIARKVFIASGKTKFDIAKSEKRPLESIKPHEYDTEIINGCEIDSLTPQDWEQIALKREIIFARTSPAQKMEIVSQFQKIGHIVGVSGDGVNDAPALKKAHLGISMNLTGSEVSKEAAHMILSDDNFATIVIGVLHGRLIFANLRKSIRYLLSHITPQVVPFLLYVGLGIPSPMSAILLMLIDLFTEFFPSVALAWEAPENNLMLDPPRKIAAVNATKAHVKALSQVRNSKKLLETRSFSEKYTPGKNIRSKSENTQHKESYNIFDSSSQINNNTSYIKNSKDPLVYTESQSNQIISTAQPFQNNPNNYSHNNQNNTNSYTDIYSQSNYTEFSLQKPSQESTKKLISSHKGEILCDANTLSWAYFEAGIIITIGALGAFFHTFYIYNIPLHALIMTSQIFFKKDSPQLILSKIFTNNKQMHILYTAQSAYFIGILIGQTFNIFICKSNSNVFNRKVWKNKLPFVGTIISLFIGATILCGQPLNSILMSRPVPLQVLVFPVLCGMFLVFWDYTRKKLKARFSVFGLSADPVNYVTLKKAKRCFY